MFSTLKKRNTIASLRGFESLERRDLMAADLLAAGVSDPIVESHLPDLDSVIGDGDAAEYGPAIRGAVAGGFGRLAEVKDFKGDMDFSDIAEIREVSGAQQEGADTSGLRASDILGFGTRDTAAEDDCNLPPPYDVPTPCQPTGPYPGSREDHWDITGSSVQGGPATQTGKPLLIVAEDVEGEA